MIKRILRSWHRYVLCALLSVIFWAWIFTLLFHAPAKHKVVLYAGLPVIDGNGLSMVLEEDLPEGIRRVDAGAIEDSIFNQDEVLYGDLYIISETDAEQLIPSFAPIDRAAFQGETFYESDGKTYGILIYDEETGLKVAGDNVFYVPHQRFYLFFNKDSRHIGEWNDSPDDGAIKVAQHFMTLKQEAWK